jgi:chemotaxis protein MotB
MAGKRKKIVEEESGGHDNGERWLLTYADMITLLLGVFVILASIGSTDMTKFMNIADQAADEFSAARILPIDGGSDKVLGGASGVLPYSVRKPREKEKPKGSDGISVTETLGGTTITLSSGILFDSGSAELKPEARKLIDEVYKKYLASSRTGIIIKGHTDNQPINNIVFPSNWELSSARASSVARYLIRKWDMSKERLITAGYADTLPLVPNYTDEDRSKNRRVEIFVLKSDMKEEEE